MKVAIPCACARWSVSHVRRVVVSCGRNGILMPPSSGLYPDAATWATWVTLMPMSTKESPVAPETFTSILSSCVGVEGRLMPFLVLINVSRIQDTDLENDML